jgi:uncharacterized protein (DUF885 family)
MAKAKSGAAESKKASAGNPAPSAGKAQPRASKAAEKDFNREFEALCDSYEKYLYKCFPVAGTSMGLIEYDGLLSNPTAAFYKMHEEDLSRYLAKFKEIPPDKLTTENRVDRGLAVNLLTLGINELQDLPDWKRGPGQYFSEPMYGIYIVLTRGGANLMQRVDGMIARAEGLPKQLKLGKKNIDNPPKLFVESSILSARGVRAFFGATLKEFAKTLKGAQKARLSAACDTAVKALDDYIAWMEKDLMPRAKGEWRAGKARFNRRLKLYHEVPFDADSLYGLGEKVFKDTTNEMKRLAKSIDPSKTWEEIVGELKKDHPTNEGLVNFYAKEMKRARSFVKKNDLVSFPPKEKIRVVETPDFARPIIPYAAYLRPGVYESEQVGIFWVTTVAEDTPKDAAKAQLEGHSKYGIVVTSLHEAYPGHHLQLTRANMKKRIFRLMHHTSVFAEGWALYCEEMMYEQGFYEDPRIRLLQLKDQLWRASRVMIDVSLHTRKMSFDEAVKFLIDKAHLEEPNAIAEVRRYCQSPTQPMSYVLGKHLVLDLRRRWRKKLGKQFSLKAFHDALIDHGTIPLARVEELMNAALES